MREVIVLLLTLLTGCAAAPLTREDHCALASSEYTLPRYALCTPDSPNRCARPMQCRAWYPGEQPMCDVDTGETRRSPLPCERCPAGWVCRDYDDPQTGAGDPLRWCFPGPACQ